MTKSKSRTSTKQPMKIDDALDHVDERELTELFAFHDLARELCIETTFLIYLVFRDKYKDASFADHMVPRHGGR